MANDRAGNTTPNEMNQIGPSTVEKIVDSFLEDELPTQLENDDLEKVLDCTLQIPKSDSKTELRLGNLTKRKVMSNMEPIYTKCNKSCGYVLCQTL